LYPLYSQEPLDWEGGFNGEKIFFVAAILSCGKEDIIGFCLLFEGGGGEIARGEGGAWGRISAVVCARSNGIGEEESLFGW